MSTMNNRISELFMVVKVGKYGGEQISQIMSRIKREMDLEFCRNPKPWYPFAYQYTPSDISVRKNIETWRTEHDGDIPPRIDVLFSPKDRDEWKNACTHRIPSRPDINMLEQTKSWKHMNRAVKGTYEFPHHYAAWGDEKRYYALIIEDLELYPFDRIETLDMNVCRTYPNNVEIERVSTINLWRLVQDEHPSSSDLDIIGRATLVDPFAVELLQRRI